MRFPAFPRLALGLAVCLVFTASPPVWSDGFAPVTLAPDEIRLDPDASRPGAMSLATLAGDMGKAGLYAVRIRMPSQLRVQPHVHPDDRMVVVLAGTLSIGFGERFEPEKMRALPAGSFFIEPAGKPHFAWVRGEDVIVQVSGIGPSGTVYLQPAAGH
ncbi:MAG TPA: cupin domain-containing protein [Thiobacillaceae bacterium]|nr:cupin domain-containing protein [Thiobacillaceae bacterium]